MRLLNVTGRSAGRFAGRYCHTKLYFCGSWLVGWLVGLSVTYPTILVVRFAVRLAVRYYLIRPVLMWLSAVRLDVRFAVHLGYSRGHEGGPCVACLF